MKNPANHVKSSIGKFQTKHPYVSLLVEAPLVIGVVAGILQVLGFPAFAILDPVKRIPVAGKIYTATADGVAGLF